MDNVILSIIKELLAISIGFVGLIFTAFSILMTLSDEHWKIKKLMQSEEYKLFINSLFSLGVWFLVFFLFSIMILIVEPLLKLNYSAFAEYSLYLYIFALVLLSIKTMFILNKFKKIVILFADRSKPMLGEFDK